VTGRCFNKKLRSKMEQIFYFKFSNVRPSTLQANKGGEVTHFVVQIRYTASIVPKGRLKGCFPVTGDFHTCDGKV
jgi:hypothetical protein